MAGWDWDDYTVLPVWEGFQAVFFLLEKLEEEGAWFFYIDEVLHCRVDRLLRHYRQGVVILGDNKRAHDDFFVGYQFSS